jgi:hypothetical protein
MYRQMFMDVPRAPLCADDSKDVQPIASTWDELEGVIERLTKHTGDPALTRQQGGAMEHSGGQGRHSD